MDDRPTTLKPEVIAQLFGRAEQAGPVTWRCDCPVCGYNCCEVFIQDDGEVDFLCYSCSDRKGIIQQACARGLITSRVGAPIDRAALVAEAKAIWAGAIPVERTEAATYLASRGLSPPWPESIKAESTGQFYGGDLLVAWRLVCLVKRRARSILGVHTIRLSDGGRRKAAYRKGGRKSLYRRVGVLDGGGVWLGAPGGELVVGEGLETTLSAMTLLGAGWGCAALGAAGLRRLELPHSAERVVIAADHDDDGREAARDARERWEAEGRDVRILAPEKPGTDFNDLLRERGQQ